MKKILAIVLAAAMMLSLVSFASAEGFSGEIKIWVAENVVDFTTEQVEAFKAANPEFANMTVKIEPVGEGDAANKVITDVESAADIYGFAQDQLGRLVKAGAIEEVEEGNAEVVAAESHYTKPEEVIDFSQRTGCDSLAISIGTSHGAHKFTPEQCTLVNGVLVPPPLAFDVLAEIEKKLPGFPIVLHGSSSVPMEEVETINKYGGKLEAAIGIPEEQLRQAAKSAVCKINIDSDSRLAMTAAIRKHLAEHPGDFDPRQYLKPARENMKKMYIHKIVNVLGSNGKL